MELLKLLLKEVTTRPKNVATSNISIIFLIIGVLVTLFAITTFNFFSDDTSVPLSYLTLFFGLSIGIFSIHNILFSFYKGNNKLIVIAINLLAVLPAIFIIFVYIGAFIGRPVLALIIILILTSFMIFIPFVSILGLLSYEAGLFVTLSLITIISTYYGEAITRFTIRRMAGYGKTDEEINEESTITTAFFNNNLYTFTVYVLYLISVFIFTILSLNGTPKGESFIVLKDVVINSFVVYVCFERVVKNSHLVRISSYIKKNQ